MLVMIVTGLENNRRDTVGKMIKGEDQEAKMKFSSSSLVLLLYIIL